MNKPERSVYAPIDFLQWREAKALDTTPKFQRRGVWKPPARSFLIDTLLQTMPVPPIYLRVVQDPTTRKVVREVVDGQQRVSAVLDFIDGKFRLSRTLDGSWRGKNFAELSREEQDRIKTYSFSAEVFQGVSDSDVLAVFARLNTYSVPLNPQELRNGKFFGYFKQSAYTLAHEHLQFWRTHDIFTETNIARMLEVELTSELLIAEIDGMQDKKKSIDDYYADYDEEFEKRERYENRFRQVIDVISHLLPDSLADTEFRRPPCFYTLFCVVYHYMYSLPSQHFPTPRKKLSPIVAEKLCDLLLSLSEKIAAARSHERVPDAYQQFVNACLSQTDNIKPRQIRFDLLYKHLV